MVKRLVLAAIVFGACGTQRVNVCNSDGDCKDPAYPFCDVNGEYPASGGDKQVCTIVPDNCPVDRCGCMAGAALSCSGDQLTTCASDGMSTATDTCALGCATDGTRCLTFEPSNGLGGALMMAAGEPDVVVPGGATIDTDAGTIMAANGVPIVVKSVVVAQSGAPSIRAFYGHSFVIGDATVVGSNPLAIVAYGTLTIQGRVDAAARLGLDGPGGIGLPSLCAGGTTQQYSCVLPPQQPTPEIDGAGGGGNNTTGGKGGGIYPAAGGQLVQSFAPLYGGCEGGAVKDSSGNLLGLGGGGGGALELVSLSQVTLSGQALISLGGGGGASSGGGGSGGTLIMEAPSVQLAGDTVGIVSNGGAGGACDQTGANASLSTSAAISPSNCGRAGGNGGTAGSAPGDGYNPGLTKCTGNSYGGAGGAVGRARIATRTGSYGTSGSPLLSVTVYPATLASR